MEQIVSVIVPVYNVIRYLDDCVSSLVNQTYKEIEIILVDDGSTDGSGNVCDEWARKDERITVIHKHNGGLSDARNVGCSMAKGKYIYFLDSDDFVSEDAIEVLCEVMNISNADSCFFDGVLFVDGHPENKDFSYYTRKNAYPKLMSGKEALSAFLVRDEYRPILQLQFFRTSFYKNEKLSFEKGIIHEDELFTYNLLNCVKKVAYVPFQLYFRRIRPGSIMTEKKKAKNFVGLIYSFDRIYGEYKNENKLDWKDLNRRCLVRIFSGLVGVYNNMPLNEKRLVDSEKKRVFKLICDESFLSDERIKKLVKHQKIKPIINIGKAIFKGVKKIVPQYVKNIVSELKSSHNEVIIAPNTESNDRALLMCMPQHGNLGDHAIALACREYLSKLFPSKNIIEIPMDDFRKNLKGNIANIAIGDIIFVCGGGWLGSLWIQNEDTFRQIVRGLPNNKIIVFPQTIYFETSERGKKEFEVSKHVYTSNKELYIYTRDVRSQDLLINAIGLPKERALLAPDMVLTLKRENRVLNRDGIRFCIRTDKEGSLDNEFVRKLYVSVAKRYNTMPEFFSTVVDHRINPDAREKEVDEILNYISQARLVITDRLHCMLFCAITGTPCLAFDNLSHKVSGVYEWIKNLDYIRLVNITDNVLDVINELDSVHPKEYGLYQDNDIIKLSDFMGGVLR